MLVHRQRIAVFTLAFVSVIVMRATAQNRGATEVYIHSGIEAFQSEDYAAARGSFEAAVHADPGLATAHYFLGLTLLQQAIAAKTDSAEQRALSDLAVEEFNQSSLLDPSMVLSRLDASRANMVLGRFDAAEAGFKAYLAERPDDPVPYLFLAVAYLQQSKADPSLIPLANENLDKAQAALERSGETKPDLEAQIVFYRGFLAATTDIEAARKAYQKALEIAPGSKAAQQASVQLRRLDAGEFGPRRPWDLGLQLGVSWDSNVVLRGRNVILRDQTDDEDWRLGLGTALTYRFVDTEEWTVGAGVATFHSWHADIDSFNVQNYDANAYTSYSPNTVPWLTLGLRYDWDISLLDNETFLVRHRVTPQIDIREGDWGRTTLFYQLDVRDYRNEFRNPRVDRDGITNALGVAQDFSLFELNNRHVNLDLSYRVETVSTEGTEFDALNQIFAAGVAVPLPKDFTFELRSEWELQQYRNRSLFDRDRSHRRDLISTFVFALTKRFTEHLLARLNVVVTSDDSNVRDHRGQEPFSYDRVVYGLALSYQF